MTTGIAILAALAIAVVLFVFRSKRWSLDEEERVEKRNRK